MRPFRFSLLLGGLLAVIPLAAWAGGFLDLWLTRDQQGQRKMDSGDYGEAADAFEDPYRRAAAFYRAGDFESAAALWGALQGSEPAFNRGNALVMLGRYEEALQSYDRALELHPGWDPASENREIARLRLERLQPPEDDAGGTGGQLGADEIRFDDTGRVDKSGSEVTAEGEKPVSDEAMRAAWLRRVQTDPSDFLRARFSYQLSRDTGGDGDE